MPVLHSITTVVPEYRYPQSEVAAFAREHFIEKLTDTDRLMTVFDNSGIDFRHFVRPISWFNDPTSFAEKNVVYIEAATDLCADAIESLLDQAGLTAQEIDAIIYVNTTGLATPSIDARLINKLKLRRDIRRTPIWGLGCAGGAAGLAQAYHYLLGSPRHRVILVAAELCSLTFHPKDFSKANLIASALFADGVAAALLEGDEVTTDGLPLLGVHSSFYPDSLDVMGWHVVNDGLQVVFARRIPQLVRDNIHKEFSLFLSDYDLKVGDINEFLLHPGGAKVLQAYQEALGLPDSRFIHARETLRSFGNMSSVTVLFVLERFLQNRAESKSSAEYAVVSALGPGFCSESLLVKI